jgi:hypothetical protein
MRVHVLACYCHGVKTGIPGGETGTVVRCRRADRGAWIALDQIREDANPVPCHPFSENDEYGRGTHVLAYPDDCDDVEEVVIELPTGENVPPSDWPPLDEKER